MERTPLTIDFLNNNIGNIIDWFSYGSKTNTPSSGHCRILGTRVDERGRIRPVVEDIQNLYDSLNWAWFEGDSATYSDSGRPVYIGKEFSLFEVQWEVPSMDLFFSTNNPMRRTIIVYNGEDANEKARAATTAKEFRVAECI